MKGLTLLKRKISDKNFTEKFAYWIRGHWGIENALHYIVNVVFR